MTCPRCVSEVPDGARFCPACGAQLAIAPGRQERKLVSVLFVDVVGSTATADGADPEDVHDRNRIYFDEARDRIEWVCAAVGTGEAVIASIPGRGRGARGRVGARRSGRAR